MDIETLRLYCLDKEGTTESFPFHDSSLTMKVNNKIYTLISLRDPLFINLKCDPEKALVLREHYPEITPGYHMNKMHWITLSLTGTLPESLIKELIDHSYALVTGKHAKRKKEI